MKTINICLLAILMCTATSCNWRNADNPSNSAPANDPDTPASMTPSANTAMPSVDTTTMMDTMPRH